MSMRAPCEQPHPNAVPNPDTARANMQSATHRSSQSNGDRYASIKGKETNQSKGKIDTPDFTQKMSKSQINLNRKRTHTHTGGSEEVIRQYNGRLGTNPQINEKLQELNQKINLIQERQLKMQGGSYNKPQQYAKSPSRVMSKSAGTRMNDVSKIVFKELKTVRNDINELKTMMETIRQSKEEENFKTNKNKSGCHANGNSNQPKMFDRSKLNKIINSNLKFSSTKSKKRQEFASFQQTGDYDEDQRTIYFHTRPADIQSKVITLGPHQSAAEVQYFVKSKSTGKLKGNKAKASLIPRGLSHKNFRVNQKSVSRKDLAPPYLDHKGGRKVSKSQTMKQFKTKNILTNDIISNVQANLDQEKSKKLTVMPKLPEGFTPMIDSEQLLSLAKKVLIAFNVKANWAKPINIKKFKNCVHFSHLNTNILWHYDGKFYIGGWNQEGEGNKQGYGIESIPQKYIYQGQFHKGKRNGFGIMTSFNGENYKGYWANGYRHGKGKQEEISGCIYEGGWVQGKKEGYGRLSFSKKQFYEGGFKDGIKNGVGREIFKNGDAYQGEYLSDKFNGIGIYRWANGSLYNGNFKDGERHGKGTWTADSSKKSDSYQGTYQNDLKSGQGKYSWANGSVYIGSFSNDQKNGEGTLFYNDGKILQAIWQDGQMIQKLYSQKPRLKSASAAKKLK